VEKKKNDWYTGSETGEEGERIKIRRERQNATWFGTRVEEEKVGAAPGGRIKLAEKRIETNHRIKVLN